MIQIYDLNAIQDQEIFLRRDEVRDVSAPVADIIRTVRAEGDRALYEYGRRFDGAELSGLSVTGAELEAALEQVEPEFLAVLREAADNIRAYHAKQKRESFVMTQRDGVILGQRILPLARVGIYVPGGTASYPSTVLMNAIPAQIAGVEDIVMVTPPGRDGAVSPAILAAAQVAGVTRIFKCGGAQAIAALAYGTESVPQVDKIVGPGNAYVAEAKKQVFGQVNIDMIAGPSEVLVLADDEASPAFAAADLLSQAEHGGDSQAVLVCPSVEFARDTQRAVGEQLLQLRRGETIREALRQSRIVVLDSREKMIGFANAYAPEHLIISMRDAWDVAAQITAAGSVFIGPWSPESAGDYASGTNHTLPTGGWARAYSGVNTDSFLRKITYQELSRKGLATLSPTVIAMAEAEGLGAHAAAVRVRMKGGVL